jgi:hypothetical protein
MGLLDEAIREHLELKRRRGADPEEVARQERDALGPVRREPEPPPAAPFDAEPEPVPEPQPGTAEPLVESVPDEPLTPSAPQSGEQTAEWNFEEDDESGPEPEPEPEEDVLEETPEFLQETPEHERLWFEQKPPRDFDFDG